MNISALAVFGVLSAVLQFVSLAPYFVDIMKGKTKPERATWWIWSLLNVIAFAAQLGAHARWSLFMTAAQGMLNIGVAVLSLKHGYGRFHKGDLTAMAFAILGVGLWWLFNSPLLALLVVVAVDLAGFWLTLAKTWRAPETETLVTWVISVVSGFFGVLAVGEWNLTKMLYPAYIAAGNLLMVVIIVTRRPRRRRLVARERA
ncbi:MAG TPA: hypothetical protein VJP80_07285 [Candidatus Saccharimonadales bacterium]|nr:hypothetical protein [Candidatus Saccharimonadales bacterium]